MALLAGMICGLLPWFLGRKRGHPGVASAGMVACIVAVPTAIVFAIVIALLPAPKKEKKPESSRSLAPRMPSAPYEV
jgi:hypothetical protein